MIINNECLYTHPPLFVSYVANCIKWRELSICEIIYIDIENLT